MILMLSSKTYACTALYRPMHSKPKCLNKLIFIFIVIICFHVTSTYARQLFYIYIYIIYAVKRLSFYCFQQSEKQDSSFHAKGTHKFKNEERKTSSHRMNLIFVSSFYGKNIIWCSWPKWMFLIIYQEKKSI